MDIHPGGGSYNHFSFMETENFNTHLCHVSHVYPINSHRLRLRFYF